MRASTVCSLPLLDIGFSTDDFSHDVHFVLVVSSFAGVAAGGFYKLLSGD